MNARLKAFVKDCSGAVTVDWVVLTAAIVGLGMVVLIPIAFGTRSFSQGVADYLGNINVGYDHQ